MTRLFSSASPVLARILSLSIIISAISGTGVAMAATAPGAGGYADVVTYLQQLAATYPDTTRLFELGLSDSGEIIRGVEISKSGETPAVNNLVVATHHGNEYGSTEVAKAFAASLAQAPIPGQAVYVIPVLNIGGYNKRNRNETAGGRSFDPNRDYPGPCGTSGPFKLKSTSALARFIDEKSIVASATLHTFYPAVVYPWGIPTHDLSTPYDDIFKALTEAATVESKYQTGNSTEVIYPAAGAFEDYAYWKHGIWSLLFEVGTTHNPTPSQIEQTNRLNVPGLRRMLEQSPRQRAERHAFEGRCDARLLELDRHDE